MAESRPEKIRNVQRWLDLVAYLVGRRMPVAVDEIMENVPAYARKWSGTDTDRDSVRRMFERDKDALREAGIPIESVGLTIDYGADRLDAYRLEKKDFHLPYLRIIANAAEAAPAPTTRARARGAKTVELRREDSRSAFRALESASRIPHFPLRAEARSAWRKLAFDLVPPPGEAGVLNVERSASSQVTGLTRELTAAVLSRKTVTFSYHGIYRGSQTERSVRPYGLQFQHGHWYLIGHDETREDIRVFRLERMEDLRANAKQPHTPDFEVPPGFSLDAYRDRQAWELGSDEEGVLRARVRFEFPLSLWAERNGLGELESEDGEGNAVRTFEVRQVQPFLRWILAQRGEATVLEPPELGSQLQNLARETLAAYEAPGGDDA